VHILFVCKDFTFCDDFYDVEDCLVEDIWPSESKQQKFKSLRTFSSSYFFHVSLAFVNE